MSGSAVVELAKALDAAEADDEEQLGLFAEPETEAGRLKVQHVRRGPGRPPGARNKRTERTVAWLLARYQDPIAGLLEVATMHTADLAAMLSCSLLEAIQEQRLCRVAALPYVKQRMPLAVDVTNRQVVYLTINEGQVEQSERSADSVAVRVLQNVEYQDVSGAPIVQLSDAPVGQDDQATDQQG